MVCFRTHLLLFGVVDLVEVRVRPLLGDHLQDLALVFLLVFLLQHLFACPLLTSETTQSRVCNERTRLYYNLVFL